MINLKKILTVTSLLMAPSIASAQLDMQQMIKPSEGEPINITSDNLIIQNNNNISIFKDNVHIIQGTMKLNADQVRLYSVYDEKTKKSKFKRIEAEGNVDFKSQDKSAKSRLATYDIDGGILIMTDNVHLKDADSSLSGQVFKYYVKSGRSEISNSSITAGKESKGSKAPVSSTAGTDADSEKDSTNPKVETSPTGRAKAVFTPGEEVKDFHMPMNALEGVKGKSKEPQATDKKE